MSSSVPTTRSSINYSSAAKFIIIIRSGNRHITRHHIDRSILPVVITLVHSLICSFVLVIALFPDMMGDQVDRVRSACDAMIKDPRSYRRVEEGAHGARSAGRQSTNGVREGRRFAA